MIDQWVIVPGFSDYSVSSSGEVMRTTPDRHGRISGRPLKQTEGNHGYFVVSMHKNARQSVKTVHRLVCEAFHGQPPTRSHHASHIDGNRGNNSARNLRWATPSENNYDKNRHGTMVFGDSHHARERPELMPRGEKHGNSKLTNCEIVKIRSDKRAQRLIASEYRVSQSLISMIRNRKIWSHLNRESTND